jgi:hypothetical protein|tara:strand:+ start:1346 stop:1525 length:180 start_codon:yes stop_codon:yes gene_type:complete
MSHPVNDTVADQVLDEYYNMSAHEKSLYLLKNKLTVLEEESMENIIVLHMYDKRFEQSV